MNTSSHPPGFSAPQGQYEGTALQATNFSLLSVWCTSCSSSTPPPTLPFTAWWGISSDLSSVWGSKGRICLVYRCISSEFCTELSVKFNNKNPSVTEIKDEIKDKKLAKKTCQIWMIKSCIPVCKQNATSFPDKKILRKLNLYQR